MSDGEQDFAAFEAAATGVDTPASEVVIEGDAKVIEPEPDKDADEPLELTEEDVAVDVPEGEDGGEEDSDAEGKRRRSKPASQRLAEERWKRGEVERERDALAARIAALEGNKEPAKAPEKPDPASFEFGEADPAYVEALTDWKLDTREAEKSKIDGARAEQQAMTDRLNAGVQKAEVEATAKYADFEDRIAEAVEARGGQPLPPMLTIGIGVSPVGGDLIYRLATDEAASARMEALASGPPRAMALALGELEGEYLTDMTDADLDLSDDLDMARMMGRMRARVAGKTAPKPEEKPEIKPTNAPEPPEHRARGGSGRFEVDGTTSDFAAFERKANGAR